MAQALAIPGDVRHSFELMVSFEHDFGRITGMAASGKRNKCILLCDYLRKNLVLVDSRGNFINSLPTESEPYDVAITWSNIGYVTLPNARSVLQVDPELMVVLMKIPCPDCNNSVLCLSRLPPSETLDESASQFCAQDDDKEYCMVTSISKGASYAFKIGPYQTNLSTEDTESYIMTKTIAFDSLVAKFHMLSNNNIIYCKSGKDYIIKGNLDQNFSPHRSKIVIPKIEVPSDVCSDDFGNIYVSGKGSNTIHRLTEEGKVLDIPLASQHGIKQPIAICFNQDYTKFYVANEWGEKVLVFRVH